MRKLAAALKMHRRMIQMLFYLLMLTTLALATIQTELNMKSPDSNIELE
jgi:hypothetical protein